MACCACTVGILKLFQKFLFLHWAVFDFWFSSKCNWGVGYFGSALDGKEGRHRRVKQWLLAATLQQMCALRHALSKFFSHSLKGAQNWGFSLNWSEHFHKAYSFNCCDVSFLTSVTSFVWTEPLLLSLVHVCWVKKTSNLFRCPSSLNITDLWLDVLDVNCISFDACWAIDRKFWVHIPKESFGSILWFLFYFIFLINWGF